MRRTRRIAWWSAYGAGAALVVAGLAWTSIRVVRLEHEEREARREAERQEVLRIALRSMDSWFSPRIAREAARMWFEYEPYHPQTIAFNRLLEPIATGEILVPSPLLGFISPVFPLHFQWRAATGFTSPQVPTAAMLAQEMIACSPVPVRDEQSRVLATWSSRIDPVIVLGELERAEAAMASNTVLANVPPAPPQQQQVQTQQVWTQMQTRSELKQEPDDARNDVARASKSGKRAARDDDPVDVKSRLDNLNAVQQAYVVDHTGANALAGNQVAQQLEVVRPTVEVGPLVPIWLATPPETLIFARRVQLGDEKMVQGVVVDWQHLERELLAQISDLTSHASLTPTPIDSEDPARLVSLPALLSLPTDAFESADASKDGPAAIGLGLVWIAVLGAIGVTGLALRSSINNALRTSRFASSVTHELRTPLTTFRLYSEMLAEGIVPEPARQREYLETLRDESARLGLLVENVLAWSRVEEGRSPSEPRPLTVSSLLAETIPVLERRCTEAGLSFDTKTDVNGTQVRTDPDRVRQVLFNLVDNACKYAGKGACVRLVTTLTGSTLSISIEDSGPGVPERLRRRVFRAFDRGERGPGDSVRGLGLGLAISNELARSLGGRMRCAEAASGSGATFSLELPI